MAACFVAVHELPMFFLASVRVLCPCASSSPLPAFNYSCFSYYRYLEWLFYSFIQNHSIYFCEILIKRGARINRTISKSDLRYVYLYKRMISSAFTSLFHNWINLQDAMMFCDRCDRGYHTFCVGLSAPPTGTWVCTNFCADQTIQSKCNKCSGTTRKEMGSRKSSRSRLCECSSVAA